MLLSRIDAIRNSREERGGISVSAARPTAGTSRSWVCLKAHEVTVDRQSALPDLEGAIFDNLQVSRRPPGRARRSSPGRTAHQQEGFPLRGESREAVE